MIHLSRPGPSKSQRALKGGALRAGTAAAAAADIVGDAEADAVDAFAPFSLLLLLEALLLLLVLLSDDVGEDEEAPAVLAAASSPPPPPLLPTPPDAPPPPLLVAATATGATLEDILLTD